MIRRKEKIIIALVLALVLLVGCSSQDLADSFDEAELRDRAKEVVIMVNEGDSESLLEMSSPELKEAFTQEVLEEVYKTINEAGEFDDFKDVKLAGDEDKDSGEKYAVVFIKAEYKEKDFIYTISFNEDMELAGLYYK